MTVQEAMQHHYELCERIKRLADYEQAINNVYAVCGTKDIVNDGINNAIIALGITTEYSAVEYADALCKYVCETGELPQDIILKFFAAGAPHII